MNAQVERIASTYGISPVKRERVEVEVSMLGCYMVSAVAGLMAEALDIGAGIFLVPFLSATCGT